MDISPAVYQFLAYGARPFLPPAHTRQLAQKASQLQAWTALPFQAEFHGIAPLLYTHLQTAAVAYPRPVKQALQGLYLRHRRANQLRTQLLQEILAAYQTAGIAARVLKGAALAHLLYPQPGLRPMRDIDILVSQADARHAQHLLTRLGFDAPLPSSPDLPDKHLLAASRHTEEMTISVEIHHNLFDAQYPASCNLQALKRPPLSFTLTPESDLVAYTLGGEEMLWHLCQHMTINASVFGATRLIWVADIVAFAERFVDQIDWAYVWHTYPLILNTLSLLHFITPLSPQLQQTAALQIGPPPQGIGRDFCGWPRAAWQTIRQHKGAGHILRDTFFPSEWWLRLHYGLGSFGSLFWYRWLKHPWDIVGWVTQLLLERRGWRAPL